MMPTMKEPAAITQMREMLANVQGDLARMPAFKNGTRWHTDRTREVAALETGIAMRLRKLAEMN